MPQKTDLPVHKTDTITVETVRTLCPKPLANVHGAPLAAHVFGLVSSLRVPDNAFTL